MARTEAGYELHNKKRREDRAVKTAAKKVADKKKSEELAAIKKIEDEAKKSEKEAQEKIEKRKQGSRDRANKSRTKK